MVGVTDDIVQVDLQFGELCIKVQVVVPHELVGLVPGVRVRVGVGLRLSLEQGGGEQLHGSCSYWCLDQDHEHGHRHHLLEGTEGGSGQSGPQAS